LEPWEGAGKPRELCLRVFPVANRQRWRSQAEGAIGAPQLTPSSAQEDPTFPSVRAGAQKRRTATRPGVENTIVVGSVEQVIGWFRVQYPLGFADAKLLAKEIDYKRKANATWKRHFGQGRGQALLREGAFDEVSQGLNEVHHATNIPFQNEIMAMNDGLKDLTAAARVLDAVLGFTERNDAQSFDQLVQAIGSLPTPEGGSRVLTWPNVTIFPFLAEPRRFMVLKPTVTKKMALRLGWDLPYAAAPTWHCYESLSRMSDVLLEQLRDLGASDYIDVQTFIWETQALD
jgi:hypothetical protein